MKPETLKAIEAEAREELDTAHMAQGVVVDVIAVVALRGFDEDGDDLTQTVILPSGAAYSMLGLLDEARIRLQADLLGAYREREDE